MAQRKDVIVMHHPDLPGREIKAITEQQAAVFERSGWKKGEAPKKAASTDKKEG